MKSRYSAYYLHNADYIIKTTHPNNTDYSTDKIQWKKDILNFTNSYIFEGLEIIDYIEDNPISYVKFKANISLHKEDYSFTETSSFEKIDNAWLYLNAKNLDSK